MSDTGRDDAGAWIEPDPTSVMADGPIGESRVLDDRYELGEVLGRGGMADVFRAHDRTLSRDVAVKVLRESAGDESDRARFVSEARTLARLSHSGLVTLLDAGFGFGASSTGAASGADDRPFLVMELVAGRTLGQAIARVRRAASDLPLDDVAAVGVQVADALDYVHRNGVVHRDVKPGNILLGPRDRVRLADFGVARLTADSSGHTRTGHIVGTAAYLAPEQVTGDEVTGATDVYSLGLVLLEAITGRREFAGPPTEAAVARLHRDPEVPETLPGEWRDLLATMVAKDPSDRPTAGEVATALRDRAVEDVPVPVESTPDAVTTPLLGRPDPQPGPQPTPRAPLQDRMGDALAQGVGTQVRQRWTAARDWVRGASESQLGLIAVSVVMVLFLVVVAIAAGGGGDDDLPDNTPSQLVEPLQELHDAAPDDEVPELGDQLTRVDAAVEAGDYRKVRATVRTLVAEVAEAQVDGELTDEVANGIVAAARSVLENLPDDGN